MRKQIIRAIGITVCAISLGVIAACSNNAGTAAGPTVTVHRYAAEQSGIFVNAYLVEIDKGVIAVDATLTVSDARSLRSRLDSLGKPLLAVLLTHGHPDHYNGTTILVSGYSDVPVIATESVDHVIREWDTAKEQQWKPMFEEEWPSGRTFPNRRFHDGESVTFDGVRFTVHDIGAGESHADSYWTVEAGGKTYAFIGDMVLNRVHAYVGDGHTTAWLKNIDWLKQEIRDVAQIYPGHGEAGGVEMLDWQHDYLTHYRKNVATLAQGADRLTDEQKQGLVTRMLQFLPSEDLQFLIALGADSVAAELSQE